ncbi:glycoside hydrolase family 6 protein [Lentzea sp. NPDC058450]|uniref:glycoside hydrolase family 6 protein n=1 Tax=Lentzea sp. NPDC058450 TaxID=3346505 RepID=UPI003647D16C
MRWIVRSTAALCAVLLLSPVTPATAASPIGMTSGWYVNPGSAPATWVQNNPNDSRRTQIQNSISTKPIARWFGNDANIASTVANYTGAADGQDKLPVLVAYNIPNRDACGGHSGGGAGSAGAYRTWIASFAAGIGAKPAVVIIEPDALAAYGCLTQAQRDEMAGLLKYATEQFKAKAPNTYAYLDAGNAGWGTPSTIAYRLNEAGVANIRGFSVNVSNYYTTSQSITYANQVNGFLPAAKPFVIDTSRNANGRNSDPNGWCNPAGAKLGVTAQTGGGAEMLLWVKTPGVSDGPCGIAPTTPAGTFNPDLAVRLINGT